MELRHALTDDQAVSPVIGVVLMVAITVTLAAVIGAFILGVDTTSTQPDVEFRYEADRGANDGWGSTGDSSESFIIHHDGGEDVDLDHVSVEYAGAPSTTLSWLSVSQPSGDMWRPGEKWELNDPDPGSGTDFQSDQQVLVLWTTSNGQSSQILASGDLP